MGGMTHVAFRARVLLVATASSGRSRPQVQVARDDGHVRNGDIVVVLPGIDGRSRTTDVLRVIRVT